jgi:hypothetical protein
MTDDEYREKVYRVAMKISKACDGEDSGTVLCAFAVAGAQAVMGVSEPNGMSPKDVIQAFINDLEVWTARYIGFNLNQKMEAMQEKKDSRATEH